MVNEVEIRQTTPDSGTVVTTFFLSASKDVILAQLHDFEAFIKLNPLVISVTPLDVCVDAHAACAYKIVDQLNFWA